MLGLFQKEVKNEKISFKEELEESEKKLKHEVQITAYNLKRIEELNKEIEEKDY